MSAVAENRERDDLDEAVEYLTAHPDLIHEAWNQPLDEMGGVLFLPLAPLTPGAGLQTPRRDGRPCGCPTQVKRGDFYGAWTSELTALVQSYDIPTNEDFIEVRHLPLFAEIQREARKVIPEMRKAGAK